MMNRIGTSDMAWWFGMHWLTMLLGAVVIVLPFWKIFAKAGFSGWLGLGARQGSCRLSHAAIG